ncbi:GntR family transcriptional regulator [Spirillospora sp. NPDC047279]|uniref:GntR family transcriptional regulator n=1 Tax=Spirillospora sp. NPDC047279 TaxID=3155478 RepID=UPI00340249AC
MAARRWREVADDLLARIKNGEFERDREGGRRKLPPESELQSQYDTSRNTIREALDFLANRGQVISEQGKGTFVVFRPEPVHVTLSATELGVGPGGGEGQWYKRDAAVQNRTPSTSEPRVEVQLVKERFALYLEVNLQTQVVSRHQEIYLDKEPWSLQTSFYPLAFVLDGGANKLLEARDIPEGAVKYLGETLGYKEAGYHDEITARAPNDNEKRFFALGDSAADVVFETIRTAYSDQGQPFRLTVTVWPADRNRLHYNVGNVPEAVVQGPNRTPSKDTTPSEDGRRSTKGDRPAATASKSPSRSPNGGKGT